MSKALILIDYINDICHVDGKIPSCAKMLNEQQIITKVNKVLSYARENKWLVVWIIVGFDELYKEANLNSPIFNKVKGLGAAQRGSWGTEILNELNYQKPELIICKNAVNPFYATNLDHVLMANAVDEVYLAGVSTEVAIQSCARDAHDRGYIVNIIGDCCASANLDYHLSSLAMLGCMANVLESKDLLVSGRAK